MNESVYVKRHERESEVSKRYKGSWEICIFKKSSFSCCLCESIRYVYMNEKKAYGIVGIYSTSPSQILCYMNDTTPCRGQSSVLPL